MVRMMRADLILVMVTLLAAIGPSLAAHESGKLGPYTVSFDMNTTSNYKVIVDPPSSGVTSSGIKFTHYYLFVNGDDGSAEIVLTSYDKIMDAGINDNKDIVVGALTTIDCDSPKLNPSTVAIDGHQSVLGSCKYPSGEAIYTVSYSPDSIPVNGTYVGKTDCRIVSTYSWNVTRDMLATLHVEVPK